MKKAEAPVKFTRKQLARKRPLKSGGGVEPKPEPAAEPAPAADAEAAPEPMVEAEA